MPKRSGYDKTFKVKDEDKDKNNKLMSSISVMKSYEKNINPFRLKLKT